MSLDAEKRKISSTDQENQQDSAEKRIRTMEENQMSDHGLMSDSEEEIDDICTDNEIVPEMEQSVLPSPFLPSYIKSCSQTRLKSTILDYTWKIDQFMCLLNIMRTMRSPPFPETDQYVIQANVLRQPDSKYIIKFYILTSETFDGSCTITIMLPPERVLTSKFIAGRIKNMTLLIEISTSNFRITHTDTLIIHCKCEIFHDLEHKTIRMDLIPPSTVFSKDVKYLENLVFDEESKDEESIKFVIGIEHYFVSKKLLRATNSSYFKNICLTHEEKEKDMTQELITYSELQTFKQILLYIITGSIDKCNYYTLKELLTAADKFDVPALKLTCEHYLLRSLTIKNAVELLQLASSCNAKFLEVHSANFIKFHAKDTY